MSDSISAAQEGASVTRTSNTAIMTQIIPPKATYFEGGPFYRCPEAPMAVVAEELVGRPEVIMGQEPVQETRSTGTTVAVRSPSLLSCGC
jgi:hypothetical protein